MDSKEFSVIWLFGKSYFSSVMDFLRRISSYATYLQHNKIKYFIYVVFYVHSMLSKKHTPNIFTTLLWVGYHNRNHLLRPPQGVCETCLHQVHKPMGIIHYRRFLMELPQWHKVCGIGGDKLHRPRGGLKV